MCSQFSASDENRLVVAGKGLAGTDAVFEAVSRLMDDSKVVYLCMYTIEMSLFFSLRRDPESYACTRSQTHVHDVNKMYVVADPLCSHSCGDWR